MIANKIHVCVTTLMSNEYIQNQVNTCETVKVASFTTFKTDSGDGYVVLTLAYGTVMSKEMVSKVGRHFGGKFAVAR